MLPIFQYIACILASYANSSFDLIVIECAQLTDNYVKLLHMLKPSGKLHLFAFIGPASSLLQEIKLSGFINCSEDAAANTLTAEKPGYETGSSARLSFAKKSSNINVWKISGDDEELIDEEDLLDEVDKQKPDPAGLRVCSTTGKRKACKNCSCGLAEELESEKSSKAAAAASENAKSSCGNVRIIALFMSRGNLISIVSCFMLPVLFGRRLQVLHLPISGHACIQTRGEGAIGGQLA